MSKFFLNLIIKLIPILHRYHSPKNLIFKSLRKIIKALTNFYKQNNTKEINFFPYNINGSLKWPLKSFGNLDSYCYFELQEMILHMYYYINKKNYKYAIDFGTNIGVDAVVLSSFGIKTFAYEPDKDLLKFAESSKKKNKIKNLDFFSYGILNENKTKTFVKVLNNLNASHIKGARGFYGRHKEIKCKFKKFQSMNIKFIPDIMKINIEGSEGKVVSTIPDKVWKNCEVFIEIHDKRNREQLWNFFRKKNLNIFSQKINWKKCYELKNLPLSNKEGYVLVSSKNQMNWG